MPKGKSLRSGQLPQEIEVWYILPALRREFAKAFITAHGLSQKKVAEFLHVTEAAVSQYVSGKRASSVMFSAEVLAEVKKSAARVVKGETQLFTELERISKLMRVKKVVCEMCRASNRRTSPCDVCFTD